LKRFLCVFRGLNSVFGCCRPHPLFFLLLEEEGGALAHLLRGLAGNCVLCSATELATGWLWNKLQAVRLNREPLHIGNPRVVFLISKKTEK
jgi:hypothetical protein